jgi:hydrogenase maturation protease
MEPFIVNNMKGQRELSTAVADGPRLRMRILCLGNDLLADDSLGSVVAEQLRQFVPREVEVVSTPESGFHLLDYVLNVQRLVVIDTVVTGTAPPGTVYTLHDDELRAVPGGSPHYVGLNETLDLARKLDSRVADDVVFLAVEAADCLTLGGEMHPAVAATVLRLVDMVWQIIRQ